MRSLLIVLVTCLLTGRAGSSARLLAPARPAISPAAVRIYRFPPRHYQEIAVLDATSGARLYHGSAAGEADAIRRLREQAAKVGANGVLLTQVGGRPSGAIGIGVGGGGISAGRHSAVAGEGSASGAAPVVRNAAEGIAIYVTDQP
ncbi:MAG TPA: hypothetical protein VH207_15600 [Chthoniobacterales bacterium]|nr:hypothetical protein [Chthoniobacterales bacterium]